MALFLLENGDFLGFRMIFKVPLSQIFSNFNTMLYTIKYRLSLIMVYFTFTVHELWPFFFLNIGNVEIVPNKSGGFINMKCSVKEIKIKNT
jgi:hypothetical protein